MALDANDLMQIQKTKGGDKDMTARSYLHNGNGWGEL